MRKTYAFPVSRLAGRKPFYHHGIWLTLNTLASINRASTRSTRFPKPIGKGTGFLKAQQRLIPKTYLHREAALRHASASPRFTQSKS
ncbi:MAG: hypothetical protein P8104_05340, partial [Gammaproteobacteria bacterium]